MNRPRLDPATPRQRILLFGLLAVAFFGSGCATTDMHLRNAALAGDESRVRELINQGTAVDTANEKGFTPLINASAKGHTEIVKLLLSRGADINKANNTDVTALAFASQEGHTEVVRVLLNQGATVNTVNTTNGATPLMHASWKGHTEIAKLLVSHGADVNKANNTGSTALAWASQEGHTEIVRLLLNQGATVNTANENGATPLILASWAGHMEIARLLIAKGAAVNAANKYRSTPLTLAGSQGHIEIVKMLLASGADVNPRDTARPLYSASLTGQADVAALLIEAGAKPVDTKQTSPQALSASASSYDLSAQHQERLGNHSVAAAHFKSAASYYKKSSQAYAKAASSTEEHQRAAAFRNTFVGRLLDIAVGGFIGAAADVTARQQTQQQMRAMAPALATSAARTAKQQGTGISGAQRIYTRDYLSLQDSMRRLNQTVAETQKIPASARSANTPGAPTDDIAAYRQAQEASSRLAALCRKLAGCFKPAQVQETPSACAARVRLIAASGTK